MTPAFTILAVILAACAAGEARGAGWGAFFFAAAAVFSWMGVIG